jgi:hypothetical protein
MTADQGQARLDKFKRWLDGICRSQCGKLTVDELLHITSIRHQLSAGTLLVTDPVMDGVEKIAVKIGCS